LSRPRSEVAGWIVLGLLLLATLVASVLFDRAQLPLVGDEATYAMQAASVAWDFDLVYSKSDYDRFVAHWGVPPVGLILQSRGSSGGDRLVYGKPPIYALITAPFVRIAPVRGGVVANALLLAAAAFLAVRALRTRVGEAAPLWVAVFLFASVAFAYVFWGEADLLLLAAVAAGYALVYGGDRTGAAPASIYQGEDTVSRRRTFGRWLPAGMLLAIAVAYRPFYLVLFGPAFLAALALPRERRGSGLGGLVLGAALLLAVSGGLQFAAGGDWTGYGGQRQGIYEGNAYPAVDFPESGWSEKVETRGSASWLRAEAVKPNVHPKLLGWNALYFLVGQNVGVLPYFLPLVLGFFAARGDRGRWAIPFAVLVAVACFLLIRPFNFYGGGPLGNRYFLALYPSLWFLAARPARPIWALIVAALAAPFLWPLWANPTAYPVGPGGTYRMVSPVAQQILPLETTQSALPGEQVAVGGGLWVKLLDHNVWPARGGQELRFAGGTTASLLVGSPQPLDALHLEFDARAPSHLEVGGTELRPVLLRPDGSIVFEVPLGAARAVHPVWWSPFDHHHYVLDLHLPGAPAAPVGFRIRIPPSSDRLGI
jgi:hypothetical protein